MATVYFTFAACAAVIVVAGVVLTRSADAIADLTGYGRLVIGSVLLAGATSLPELSIGYQTIRLGQPDLAVGNLVGACLCNLLILAGLDLSHRTRSRMFSPLASAHALSATMTVNLCAVAVLAMLVRPGPSFQLLGMGVGSLTILAVYAGGSRLVYLNQQMAALPETPGPDHAVLMPAPPSMSVRRAAAGFAAATAVILVASPFLARAADDIAEQTGLGRSFVGTVLLALSTTLPELVASITAVRLGAFDLALGNVFGSNAFNILLIAILDIAQDGPLLGVVAPVHAVTGVAVILVTSVAILGQLYRIESRISLVEPDAVLVAALVLGAMGLAYHLG